MEGNCSHTDKNSNPVYWNKFNNVLQCHKCGQCFNIYKTNIEEKIITIRVTNIYSTINNIKYFLKGFGIVLLVMVLLMIIMGVITLTLKDDICYYIAPTIIICSVFGLITYLKSKI